ncbi:MAG: DUF4421 family protein, partial [Nanoarchaeota archaeon]
VYSDFKNSFSGSSFIDYAASFQYGISVGYIYTFVIKKRWYATISFNPGLSVMQYYSRTIVPDSAANLPDSVYYSSKGNIASKLQTRIAFGYNTDRWYGGMAFMGDSFSQDNKSSAQVDYSFGSFRLFIGRRFNLSRKKNKK